MALFKITTIKEFTYRGQAEQFSNSYVFSGTDPADATAWNAWVSKMLTIEMPMFPSTVKLVRFLGYKAGSWETKPQHVDHLVDYTVGNTGSLSTTTERQAPGDAAFWIRWDTGQFTTRGKKIYLRKYFHGVMEGGANVDTVAPVQVTAANAFAAKLYDGTSLIGTARLARDTGTLPVAHLVGPYITTRTLKRRGKRNPTP